MTIFGFVLTFLAGYMLGSAVILAWMYLSMQP